MRRWLARVRHDLIKHVAWRARDLRDLGAAATAADLRALRRVVLELPGDEGAPVGAAARWRQLRAEIEEADGAPAPGPLDDFERAVLAAEAAARALGDDDGPERPAALAAALALEGAFAELARRLDPGT